jgi:superfamily II DNA or RNA helicase
MPKYKAGMWDGYISLMRSMSEFPTGLLTLVEEQLQKYNVDYELLRQSTPDFQSIDADCLNGITLRDYQLDASRKLLEAGRGVAKMATNSGKTEVIASIVKALNIPPTIVIVHIKDLLYQTAQRLEDRLGVEVGIIGDGRRDKAQITVGMVQTLYNMLNEVPRKKVKSFMLLPNNVLMVVDECHHASSNTMMDVMYNIPGPYRFGLSGTPLKYDALADMKLIANTGDVTVEVSNDYMIEAGWSAKPTIHMHIIEDINDALWKMDYSEAYSSLIVQNLTRNQIIIDRANTAEGVVLTLVNQIEHGNILRDGIPNSVFVHGGDNTDYRQGVLDTMRAATKGVFIASPIFDEGIDVPSVDMVILAGGGKAHTKLLQRVGRGLRQKDGQNELIVIDFMDDTNKYLLEHSRERIEVYGQEGFEVQVQRGDRNISTG